MSIMDDLNRIADMQGKPPIDGTRIQDNTGDPWPETTAYPPNVPANWLNDDPDESPLVPRRSPEDRREAPVAAPGPSVAPDAILGALQKAAADMPSPDLLIIEKQASYRGHSVALSDDEQRAVAAVIVRALKRQLGEIEGSLGRRVRIRRGAARRERLASVSSAEGGAGQGPTAVVSKRGPGRPSKVKP